jgi:hypothetical protein
VLKSPDQKVLFGGLQGAQFDPCYHQVARTRMYVTSDFMETTQACDSYPGNIGLPALSNNFKVLAYTVQYLSTLENVRHGTAMSFVH